MATLMQANAEWRTRPADERFVSLIDMQQHFGDLRRNSRERVVSSRKLHAVPQADHSGILIEGPNGQGYAPSHFSFGQLATLAEAPAGYLRRLPAELASDCINLGLNVLREVEDVQVLISKTDAGPQLRAATGPRYGRIWNAEVVNQLVDRFGDGVSGHWRVPGEFGKAVTVTKDNTTLYGGDRDMFVFLADEKRRITVPNRRNGEPGSLARGFLVWNSEVGAATFGLATFLFDYVCCNRIIWGALDFKEIKIRHTAAAPDRFLERIVPALDAYSAASDRKVVQTIEQAQRAHLENRLDEFLASRFSKGISASIKAAHEMEEGRPIETAWDVVVGATAVARSIPHQDERVALEREAGKILSLVA